MVFPIFMAGCEALDEYRRNQMLGAMRRAETCGMAHVQRARLLMQKVWETGKPWQMMIGGEFFG